MKICMPVEVNEGLLSKPFGHFGSAPMFLVYDLESNEVSALDNGDLGHEHGKCQPIKALSGNVVDAVIVGGIGQGAIVKLNSMGIKVYKALGATLKENIDLFNENKLNEFPSNHTCSHDGCNHH
ncbi:NifB/NifX family molybdenum-iron cluster-binding protein [Romboutsia sp. MSSM.1001216sp_RTP31141st1_G3_RTP31141_220114]|uniref:NifB/NifX family molybdenum-iron cluster-binding protein n=1 Tax=unclassified Romboutsia TaxID=2626894 RepID=UPI0031B61F72